MTDALPSGLTATAMFGIGWNCNTGTVSCTRTDALAAGGTYPAITLTVTVGTNAPPSVVNTATVSTSGEFNTANNTASDPTSILVAPSNLVATAISTSQAVLSWSAVPGATRYQVLRSVHGGAFAIIGQPVTNSFNDQGLFGTTTYVYVVKAAAATNVTPASNPDVATTMLFTDDPLMPGSTLIRPIHVLRGGAHRRVAARGRIATQRTSARLSPRSRSISLR